ncbi:hypothetical protein DAEQUDRAFT_327303 [Daedalea quercina L-15889]|uniref:Uncharacterized protein n=1 Tax=Daedalea quercina L-15889 TaxID=1314783 RepID=A0A165PPI3_9APHY|nr:hypothetical protein DAEQUDRAFT_327303 [Daedalea quercina L-15889]
MLRELRITQTPECLSPRQAGEVHFAKNCPPSRAGRLLFRRGREGSVRQKAGVARGLLATSAGTAWGIPAAAPHTATVEVRPAPPAGGHGVANMGRA